MLFDDALKNKIPIFKSLPMFGFKLENENYVYACPIVDEQFIFYIYISKEGKVSTKVIDSLTNDEYTLHLAQTAQGSFVGRVRIECLEVLQKVVDNCFETRIFQSEYAAKIIEYVKEKYNNEFEYLWEKFPENAIIRRDDNQKWYAIILTVREDKLDLQGHNKIEVIDLRMAPEQIEKRVDNKLYFRGYHMNKKHWITIRLDGSVDIEEIFNLIDESYLLAKKK